MATALISCSWNWPKEWNGIRPGDDSFVSRAERECIGSVILPFSVRKVT